MTFLDTICEKDNTVINLLNQCKDNGLPTYILGDGEGADNTEKRAKDFQFSGRLVNRKYYNSRKGVYCLEDFMDSSQEKINLIVAYKGFNEENLARWKDRIKILINGDFWAENSSIDKDLLTYSFCVENEHRLEEVYNELKDEQSKRVMSAYINQKISSDFKYLKEVKSYPQYFERSIIQLNNDEVFVDCGAYDGDTALAFIKELNYRGLSDYKRIISIEPDPYNFAKLVSLNLCNHICINKGTADSSGELSFSIVGTSSGFDENGEIKVAVDELDNMTEEDVTFIKMDIEGAELASLKGAKNLIKRSRPKCAICIYHKREDLWEIMNYLKSLVPEYKFYMRAYADTATEVVLYAII